MLSRNNSERRGKVNPEVKAKWVAALRSGDYKQATGHLRVTTGTGDNQQDGFCCLGVLCDLAVKAEVIGEPDAVTLDPVKKIYRYDGEGTMWLPAKVADWAEMPAGPHRDNPFVPDPRFHGEGMRQHLASLNDDKVSFDEIADLIEQYL